MAPFADLPDMWPCSVRKTEVSPTQHASLSCIEDPTSYPSDAHLPPPSHAGSGFSRSRVGTLLLIKEPEYNPSISVLLLRRSLWLRCQVVDCRKSSSSRLALQGLLFPLLVEHLRGFVSRSSTLHPLFVDEFDFPHRDPIDFYPWPTFPPDLICRRGNNFFYLSKFSALEAQDHFLVRSPDVLTQPRTRAFSSYN